MSIIPSVVQGTLAKGLDLRTGQASEAAVKAIMEKWQLTVEHQDEVAQQPQQPRFTQSQPSLHPVDALRSVD